MAATSAGSGRGALAGPAAVTRLLLPAILLLGLALRLFHLDHLSFWGDESASLHFARWPLPEIWGADTMPPLYYSLLHVWRLGGESVWWLRLSSALVSFASLPLAYGLGCRLGGRGLGLWLCFALATAPFSLHYAQELRMYALLEFAALLTFYALSRLLLEPARAAVPPTRSGSSGRVWLLYALGSLLALYTHNTGVLVPMTACVLAAAAWWRSPLRRRLLRNWVLVNGAVLALWALYWPWLLEQARWVSEKFWVSTPGFFEFFRDLAEIHLGHPAGWVGFAGGLPVLAALLGGLVLLWRRRRALAIALLIVLLLPPLTELLLGFIRPIFLPRTLIWTGLAGALALAAALQVLRRRSERMVWPWGLLLALVLLGRGLAVADYYQGAGKPDWRSLAATASDRVAPGEPILVVPYWESLTLDYYLGRMARGEGAAPLLVPYRGFREAQMRGLLLAAMPRESVWIARVSRFKRPEDRTALLRQVLPCATLAESLSFAGLELERYDVAACADR